MKTENELRQYLEEVKKQIIEEKKAEHWHLVRVGKIIMSVLMYVLEDRPIDINNLESEQK